MITADNERIIVCENPSFPPLILYTRTIDSYLLKIGKHISNLGDMLPFYQFYSQ